MLSTKILHQTNLATNLAKNLLSSKGFCSEINVEQFKLRSKFNTVFNVCPQRQEMIVERFGKFYGKIDSGWFLAIPLVDKIRYNVNMRELTIPINPQTAITKDNVSVELGGNVYVQFINAYDAAYGAQRPIYAVVQHAQSAMRSIVGETTLDELFHNRNRINTYILNALEDATKPWGLKVHRYEVTTVRTEDTIHAAMNKQAAAERQRREDVLRAEAVKKTLELESVGQKEKLINESEGMKIEKINEAIAKAEAVRLAADAEYFRLTREAEGQAEALKMIGEQLESQRGKNAVQYKLAAQYIEAYGEILGKSNTLILPNQSEDVSGFIVKAMAIYNQTKPREEN